jgi:hypothetical protein
MLGVVLALAMGQLNPLPNPAGPLFTNPATMGSFAFFEFAPQGGAGMGAACACTTPTGAKGEALTFTRTGDATCSRAGLATTGITDGALSTCTANQPRVEPSGGVLGLRVEGARTFPLVRFIDFTNAIWSDVGTPTPTTGQTSPWTGALSTAAVLYDDNDAAAQEGRAQTVTVTASVAHTMHCYVKAGTLTSAAISLDGTTSTITGLVTTSWNIIEVTDASSSGTAIVAQILNGSTAAATGTVIWGGCAVEQGSYRTSIMPTVASAMTRNAEAPTVSGSWPSATSSIALTVQPTLQLSSRAVTVRPLAVSSSLAQYTDVETFGQVVAATGTASLTSSFTPTGLTRRLAAAFDGTTNYTACMDGACQSAARSFAGVNATQTTINLGRFSGGDEVDGIITRVCVDPDPTRCR